MVAHPGRSSQPQEDDQAEADMLLQGKDAVVHVRKVVDVGPRANPSGGGSVDDRVDPDRIPSGFYLTNRTYRQNAGALTLEVSCGSSEPSASATPTTSSFDQPK
jgi:hypothetical protein